jgi:hypothetical protein
VIEEAKEAATQAMIASAQAMVMTQLRTWYSQLEPIVAPIISAVLGTLPQEQAPVALAPESVAVLEEPLVLQVPVVEAAPIQVAQVELPPNLVVVASETMPASSEKNLVVAASEKNIAYTSQPVLAVSNSIPVSAEPNQNSISQDVFATGVVLAQIATTLASVAAVAVPNPAMLQGVEFSEGIDLVEFASQTVPNSQLGVTSVRPVAQQQLQAAGDNETAFSPIVQVTVDESVSAPKGLSQPVVADPVAQRIQADLTAVEPDSRQAMPVRAGQQKDVDGIKARFAEQGDQEQVASGLNQVLHTASDKGGFAGQGDTRGQDEALVELLARLTEVDNSETSLAEVEPDSYLVPASDIYA